MRHAAVTSHAYHARMTTPAQPLPPCPRCGSTDAVEILYGYPTFEAGLAADRGEIVLGGCVVGPESAEYECRGCKSPLPWVLSDGQGAAESSRRSIR